MSSRLQPAWARTRADYAVWYWNPFDIEVLDHLTSGRQRYVSLKERGLGFSQR